MATYDKTVLERDIEKLYRHLGITEPDELNMYAIADKLNVWLYVEPIGSRAIDRDGLYSVIIDSRLSPQEQWEDFGHELCHLLRHGGNQLLLPPAFVQFQETKAANFGYQFCVPTFMLLELRLPEHEREAAAYVAELFGVRPQFARERLRRFQQQRMSSQWREQLVQAARKEEEALLLAGADYVIRTGQSALLYSRERGVVGYRKGEELS